MLLRGSRKACRAGKLWLSFDAVSCVPQGRNASGHRRPILQRPIHPVKTSACQHLFQRSLERDCWGEPNQDSMDLDAEWRKSRTGKRFRTCPSLNLDQRSMRVKAQTNRGTAVQSRGFCAGPQTDDRFAPVPADRARSGKVCVSSQTSLLGEGPRRNHRAPCQAGALSITSGRMSTGRANTRSSCENNR